MHRPGWPLSHENGDLVLRPQTWFPGAGTAVRLPDPVWGAFGRLRHGRLSLASPVPSRPGPQHLPPSLPSGAKRSPPSFSHHHAWRGFSCSQPPILQRRAQFCRLVLPETSVGAESCRQLPRVLALRRPRHCRLDGILATGIHTWVQSGGWEAEQVSRHPEPLTSTSTSQLQLGPRGPGPLLTPCMSQPSN